MRSLEDHYSNRLEQTEEHRITIRKLHAPRLARLTLEITSLGDVVQHGKLFIIKLTVILFYFTFY